MSEKYVIIAPSPIIGNGEVTELFLAGGITNCPDWQKEALEMIETEEDIIIYNPRRERFDVNDPSATDIQVKWENERLERSDAILFWFPMETLCPIVLYEFGRWGMSTSKELYVGTHPEYKRRKDVIKQAEYSRPDIKVETTLENVVNRLNMVLTKNMETGAKFGDNKNYSFEQFFTMDDLTKQSIRNNPLHIPVDLYEYYEDDETENV